MENRLKAKFGLTASVLDCCFSFDPSIAYSGGLDKQVSRLELSRVQTKVIGKHDEAVKCVVPCKTTGTIMDLEAFLEIFTFDPRSFIFGFLG